ncbi:MAG: DUF2281 domain-containing protein [Azonexus sp.]|nr:DUF2281 domain-containing protein [Azonexus sp.]
MGYAEKVYEQVQRLAAEEAKEVLDFAEFVAARAKAVSVPAGQADRSRRRAELEKVFSKYRIDLSNFEFDREEANARH